MKQYITFDLDGTLMQNPFVSYVFPEIEQIAKEKGLSDEISMKNLLVEEHNARMSKGQIVEAYDWDQIVSSLFSSQQLTWDQEIEELVKKHSTKGKVYLLNDEIIATLQQLRSKGYTLVAATNGFAKYQLPVMEFLGIASHFDVILTPDQTGYAKPDSRMLESLVSDGNIVAHVGDRIDHDVYMANESGWTSVFITRSLPESLTGVNPYSRPSFMGKAFQEKWVAEHHAADDFDIKLGIPNMVIGSVSELIGGLNT